MESNGLEILGIVNLITSIVVVVIEIAGVAVSAILMRRHMRGALFALIGFSALLFNVVSHWLANSVGLQVLHNVVSSVQLVNVITALSCLSSFLTGLGLALIIAGFWQLGMDRRTRLGAQDLSAV